MNPDINDLKNILAKHLRWNDPRLMDGVRRLREWMGPRRTERPRGYMAHGEGFHAYLAYYLPLHLGEVFWILDQQRELFRREVPTEVWDLGSGPGTASLSLILWLKKEGLPVPKELHLVDTSNKALEVASDFVAKISPQTKIYKHRANILAPEGFRLLRQPSDEKRFYILSHLLNEIGSGPRKRHDKYRLVEYLFGRVLVVEPPLREPTLDLMHLRDWLLEEEQEVPSEILAPCPRSQGRCPLLARKMGWCYAQPPRTWLEKQGLAVWEKELKRLSGTRLQDMGFSYLLFDRGTEESHERPAYEIQVSDTRSIKSLYCDGTKINSRTRRGSHRGDYHLKKNSADKA